MGSFEPVVVLYEYDGPRIFTTRDADGELNLVYWADGDSNGSRYIVVPTTQQIIDSLRTGGLSVLDALKQTRCWVCDVIDDGIMRSCMRTSLDEIPADALPAIGTMLWPTLEPLLTLRAVGNEIGLGHIPSSVIRSCVDGVQKAFKVLAEYVLELPAQIGRPKDFIRRLFDLPTQRMAFASFEISFRMPIAEEHLFSAAPDKSAEAKTLEEVGMLLNKGLTWLATDASTEGMYKEDAEASAILRALKELAPSSQGSIDRLELKGQLIGPRTSPLVLDRTARQKVTAAIRNRFLEPKVIELEGLIRELDKDRMSFDLREITGPVSSQRFVFDEDLREDVFLAFSQDARVKIAGKTFPPRNVGYALALSQVQEPNIVTATK